MTFAEPLHILLDTIKTISKKPHILLISFSMHLWLLLLTVLLGKLTPSITTPTVSYMLIIAYFIAALLGGSCALFYMTTIIASTKKKHNHSLQISSTFAAVLLLILVQRLHVKLNELLVTLLFPIIGQKATALLLFILLITILLTILTFIAFIPTYTSLLPINPLSALKKSWRFAKRNYLVILPLFIFFFILFDLSTRLEGMLGKTGLDILYWIVLFPLFIGTLTKLVTKYDVSTR